MGLYINKVNVSKLQKVKGSCVPASASQKLLYNRNNESSWRCSARSVCCESHQPPPQLSAWPLSTWPPRAISRVSWSGSQKSHGDTNTGTRGPEQSRETCERVRPRVCKYHREKAAGSRAANLMMKLWLKCQVLLANSPDSKEGRCVRVNGRKWNFRVTPQHSGKW